jgi:hypothetical protein
MRKVSPGWGAIQMSLSIESLLAIEATRDLLSLGLEWGALTLISLDTRLYSSSNLDFARGNEYRVRS